MTASPEPVRLDIRDEEHGAAMVREAGACLRAGSPVAVFCHLGGAVSVLAFRAKPVPKGFFVVAADYKKTGTWPTVEALAPVALKSVEGAFRNMRGEE